MRSLATKILDVFKFKFEQFLVEECWQNFTPTNRNYEQINVEEKDQ